MFPKSVIVRNPDHLRLVAGLRCLVTGIEGQSHAHHLLRITDHYGRSVGVKATGLKNGDNYAVPLHYKIHDALHRDGDEVEFFKRFGITNQSQIAHGLYLCVHPLDMVEYLEQNLKEVWRQNAKNPEVKRILSR